MKLVEILARDWSEWPKKCEYAVCDIDGEIRAIGTDCRHDFYPINPVDASDRLSTFALMGSDSKRVTREIWQAEREKLEAYRFGLKQNIKPKQANAEGWIRHRGGKCPVDGEILVDVRYRSPISGQRKSGLKAKQYAWDWRVSGKSNGNIMAYRLHKPAEQPANPADLDWQEVQTITAATKREHPVIEGPIQWRDRIREIDRTLEALEEERVSLIQQLEGEGLQLLVGKVCGSVQVAEDMSDPSNWRRGDLITFVLDRKDSSFTTGKQYTFNELDGYGSASIEADDEGDVNGWSVNYFKWHSRPSA